MPAVMLGKLERLSVVEETSAGKGPLTWGLLESPAPFCWLPESFTQFAIAVLCKRARKRTRCSPGSEVAAGLGEVMTAISHHVHVMYTSHDLG